MKKILVANRGEIALRVMRSAREMGIKTVAIFSEADRNAPFVKYADEAVCIGPPPSILSYLLGDDIIKVSKRLKVDGIHPGYGFLSENAEFAKKVKKAGITFIGPPAEAIDVMGNKLAAKAAVKSYNIPMIPGTENAIDNPEEAKKIAREIGFPILIKAAAGGGGVGDPLERDSVLVLEDVRNDMLSLKDGEKVYAVVIDEKTRRINHDATEKLRKKIKHTGSTL